MSLITPISVLPKATFIEYAAEKDTGIDYKSLVEMQHKVNLAEDEKRKSDFIMRKDLFTLTDKMTDKSSPFGITASNMGDQNVLDQIYTEYTPLIEDISNSIGAEKLDPNVTFSALGKLQSKLKSDPRMAQILKNNKIYENTIKTMNVAKDLDSSATAELLNDYYNWDGQGDNPLNSFNVSKYRMYDQTKEKAFLNSLLGTDMPVQYLGTNPETGQEMRGWNFTPEGIDARLDAYWYNNQFALERQGYDKESWKNDWMTKINNQVIYDEKTGQYYIPSDLQGRTTASSSTTTSSGNPVVSLDSAGEGNFDNLEAARDGKQDVKKGVFVTSKTGNISGTVDANNTDGLPAGYWAESNEAAIAQTNSPAMLYEDKSNAEKEIARLKVHIKRNPNDQQAKDRVAELYTGLIATNAAIYKLESSPEYQEYRNSEAYKRYFRSFMKTNTSSSVLLNNAILDPIKKEGIKIWGRLQNVGYEISWTNRFEKAKSFEEQRAIYQELIRKGISESNPGMVKLLNKINEDEQRVMIESNVEFNSNTGGDKSPQSSYILNRDDADAKVYTSRYENTPIKNIRGTKITRADTGSTIETTTLDSNTRVNVIGSVYDSNTGQYRLTGTMGTAEKSGKSDSNAFLKEGDKVKFTNDEYDNVLISDKQFNTSMYQMIYDPEYGKLFSEEFPKLEKAIAKGTNFTLNIGGRKYQVSKDKGEFKISINNEEATVGSIEQLGRKIMEYDKGQRALQGRSPKL